jgi:hypothetical protein
MNRWVSVSALAAMLFLVGQVLVGQGFPGRRLLVTSAVTPVLVVPVGWLESLGLWPPGTTR